MPQPPRILLIFAALAWLSGCGLTDLWRTPGLNIGSGTVIALPPERLALVIGNADYVNIPLLRNPGNDADDMCAALRALGYRTLCHRNLRNRAEFDARVREYVALLGPQTVGVVYYSGHGVQARGANFLVPTDVQVRSIADDPTRVMFSLQELFERLREKRSRLQLVVLDACRTDLFAAGQSGGRSVTLRSLEIAARGANGLLPITDAPPATAVLYASGSGDVAFDGHGRNGPMTQVLLQRIRTRSLKLKDLLDEVTRDVQTITARDYGRAMTPFVYGSYDGSVCLGGCVRPFDDTPR